MIQRTRIYLVRHGQVEGFEEKRYNGQVNVPLTEVGKEQSKAISDNLSGVRVDAIYSSDLERSKYCAELVAKTHGISSSAEPALRELHIGDWEGRTWAELQAACPDDWRARLNDLVSYKVPGGESLQDAADRIRPCVQKALEQHQGKTIVVVAHGGVNRIVLLDAIGATLEQAFSIEQDYGCINIIDYFADGQSVVKLLNGVAHLPVDTER
jgi:alpha-ribazole phosphatase/probable phosphoglycerate mutase